MLLSPSGEPGWCYWINELPQNQPEADHAVTLATRAVDVLTNQAESARCVDLLAGFVGHLAPTGAAPPSASAPNAPPRCSPLPAV